jgi:hypothetical protein
VLSKSRIFKFLKRDCGTIPVAEITSGKIEIFSMIIVIRLMRSKSYDVTIAMDTIIRQRAVRIKSHDLVVVLLRSWIILLLNVKLQL